MNERTTLNAADNGHLIIGGCDALELAKEFGTPLYVFDEAYIRAMMRVYKKTIESRYGGNGNVLYASKAFSCEAVYRIAQQENIGCDAVSGGELYTALKAGFNPANIYVHGNNKLFYELEEAVDAGVGGIVLDSISEAEVLDGICRAKSKTQDVLIRINPGVEAHTHAFVQTARTDSKFGFSISDGSALEIIKGVLALKNVRLKGFHCHIGSQIFEKQSFVLAADKMLDFIKHVKDETGFVASVLNMGGGFGIYYTDDDPKLKEEDYATYLTALIDGIKGKARELNLPEPYLLIEPGRSIVGESGITLYTVGTIKDIPGIKKYVAVDGGMFEAPRYALYQSKYCAAKADDVNAPCTQVVSIAGKCCESGDLVAADVRLPEVKKGDILAVFSTGAYHYSMASNYNRNFVPAAVLVKDGKADIIVKRQNYEDLVRNDVIPERLK